MSFGRHRQVRENIEVEFQKKIIQETKDFAVAFQKEIDAKEPEKPVVIEGDIVVHQDTLEDIELIDDDRPMNDPSVIDELEAIKKTFQKKAPAKKIVSEVKAEEIKRVPIKKRKKRRDRKEYNYIGVIGDSVECRDFRAIVKKKGEQINNVLTKILHDWNTANYNL